MLTAFTKAHFHPKSDSGSQRSFHWKQNLSGGVEGLMTQVLADLKQEHALFEQVSRISYRSSRRHPLSCG